MPTSTQNPDPTQQNGGFFGTLPVAQTPVNPAPQPTTPVLPTPQTVQPQQTGVNANQTVTQGQLAMPANGSVVDLLNSAGQDSSFAARQQLAQQYGVQNYAGTAAQNTDLAKKYLAAYSANKGTTVPQNGADARTALGSYFDNTQQTTSQQDPTQQFMDTFAGMNPAEANIYQQLSTILSTPNTQQSLSDLYTQEAQAQGIPALQLQQADLNRIINGSEDDIRAEITNAGGFATESQVQALTGARNKTLINQANYLQNAINAKNDYVDRIVSLTQADRDQVSKDLDQKLGIAKTLFDMTETMSNAAKDNLNQVIQTQGYGGLYTALQGDPQQVTKVEQLLGLGTGGLKALASYTKPLTAQETLQNQNLTLQNEKLQQDLSGAGSADLQFVAGTANQPAGVFNKATGSFTPIKAGDLGSQMQLSLAQNNIGEVDNLLASSALSGVVGPNILARNEFFNKFDGASSNFLAGMQQLQNQLTLTNLQDAKANGATFGALSEGELGLLSSSATKLNSWAIKDRAGNVTGYSVDEKSFKQELDKINNYAKLDYVLKGGDPSSVNVVQMQDGTLWTKNSDGTNVEIK